MQFQSTKVWKKKKGEKKMHQQLNVGYIKGSLGIVGLTKKPDLRFTSSLPHSDCREAANKGKRDIAPRGSKSNMLIS